MKRALFLFLVAAIAAPCLAQSGTLSAPITPPSQTTIVVGNVMEHRADPNNPNDTAQAAVELWLLTGSGVRADVYTVFLSGVAEVQNLEIARSTPAPNETGSGARVQNYRILYFLKNNCTTFQRPCSALISALSLVP